VTHRDAAAAVDVILEWNAIALDAVVTDCSYPDKSTEQGGPTRTARALAIAHIAMYDAANSVVGSGQPFLFSVPLSKSASFDAAVAKAACDTLCALYTKQKSKLSQTLQRVPAGPAKVHGLLVGTLCAQGCLMNRAADGASDNTPYQPGDQPGDHREDPLHAGQGFLTPNWGYVKPFAIRNVADFPIGPPPALNSPEYAAAFNQVKELGAKESVSRTADQTIVGTFWGYDGTPGLGTPPRLYNQVVRTIAIQKKNTPMQNARLFALVNIAQADAGIAAWYEKYHNNFWRPILAIREADPGTGPSGLGDGNPATEGDVNWEPLGAPASNASGTNFTPPFPAYASGHATFGAATFQILRRFYGTDNIMFTFMSDEYNGQTTDQHGVVRPPVLRHYNTLSEADEENGMSRIYLGIHWIFDKTAGMQQGRAIANQVFNTTLRPRN
jgi:hypothetical protein